MIVERAKDDRHQSRSEYARHASIGMRPAAAPPSVATMLDNGPPAPQKPFFRVGKPGTRD